MFQTRDCSSTVVPDDSGASDRLAAAEAEPR
jgi:hypothetical protein